MRRLLHAATWPSIPVLVWLYCFFFVLSTGPTWLFGDGDLGWHIQTGKLIESTRSIPTCDVHSWTAPGVPWVDIEWLSNYFYWKTLQLLGFTGMLAIEAAFIASAFALVAKTCLLIGAESVVAVFVTAWAFRLSSIHWFVRPHLRTWMFVALWCLLLWRYARRGGRVVWLVPLLTPLWINLHGGWPAGCITLAIFALGDVLSSADRRSAGNIRRWLLVGGATFVLTFASPYGYKLHKDVIEMVSAKGILDMTQEWKAPDFRGNAKPFRWFLLTTLGAMAFIPAVDRARAFILLVIGSQMVLESIRHMPLFLVWLAPVTALGLTGAMEAVRTLGTRAHRAVGQYLNGSELLASRFDGATGLAWPVLAMALAVAGTFPPVLASAPAGFAADRFPLAAVEHLKVEKPPGRLLNDYTWGGYLTWALPDGFPVFLDGRNVMYGYQLSVDWLTLATLAPGWEALLAKYDIGWTLFPTGAPLTKALRAKGWTAAYADSVATVLQRPAGGR